MVYSDTGPKKHTGCCHNDLLHSVTMGNLRVNMKKMR